MVQPLLAFQYKIEDLILRNQSMAAHESITFLAYQCVLESTPDNPPDNCLKNIKNIEERVGDGELLLPSISGKPVAISALLDASSWPDDPTRQGKLLYGAKARINLGRKCRNIFRFFGKEDYTDSISGGLFCNSHLGVLQFFHSMASKPTYLDEYQSEPYEVTRNKILEWIAFNYKVVRDSTFLDQGYCDYFRDLKKDGNQSAIAEIFLPTYLEDKLAHCTKNFKLDWIYNNKCSHPVRSSRCFPVGDTAQHQVTALGAIIHAIQDSFAQGHAKRGECSKNQGLPVAKIECEPIKQFYNYNVQDDDKHDASDVMPISVQKSCHSGDKVVDVVTATAYVLWHAMYEKDNSLLVEYIEDSVYQDPYAPEVPPLFPSVDAAGCCYMK